MTTITTGDKLKRARKAPPAEQPAGPVVEEQLDVVTAAAQASAEQPAKPKRAPRARKAPAPPAPPAAPAVEAAPVAELPPIPVDLRFTTPKRERARQPVEERTLDFSIDEHRYTLIRPEKLPEALAGLIESGARRATEADAIHSGMTFLRKVVAPESLARIQARLDDDDDDLSIVDVFDMLDTLAVALVRSAADAGAPVPAAAVPARARAAR